ncbi:MAG: carboxypeptidase-like regulatory domain-containing protein [Bryobacteraceae bacterium]
MAEEAVTMKSRRLAKVFASMAALLVLSGAAYGQRTTANIYGVVQDPTGALVPRAKITAINKATGYQQTATSDDRGEFTLGFLPVGRYQPRVEASRFKAYVESGIVLEAGQRLR